MKKHFLFAFIVLLNLTAEADVRLPSMFSDNMVLQRDQAIPVWGWAAPGEKITVQINEQVKKITAGKDGKWMVKLPALKAGGPYQLIVKGKNTITISNVLIGEVWLCSGQSNMEMPIEGWGKIDNYEQEIRDAKYPLIRQFNVVKSVNANPQEEVKGDWMICEPANAGNFIATGYFFARELAKKLNVPVGIINCSWGGSMIETWISRDAFEKSSEFKEMIAGIPANEIGARDKQLKDAVSNAVKEIQSDIPEKNQTGNWSNKQFDDSKWPAMKLPGVWEKENPKLSELNGIVWFRKPFDVPAKIEGDATISIGVPDDVIDVFINGIKLNSTTNLEGQVHTFSVSGASLEAGKNEIAMRVRDYGGSGGVTGDDKDMFVKLSDTTLPLNGEWKYQVESIGFGANPNSYPTLLYNSMVNPLVPYAIKGALWYQGETNAGRAYQYRTAFPLLINNWREKWGQGEFPFYFVQLSSFNADGGNSEKGSTWAELREAQSMTLNVPNTGIAITTDIGNATDIHPKNKQDVGKRLALVALAKTYNVSIPSSGPVYSEMRTEGDKVVVSFLNSGELVAKDKYGYLKGFEVAGADQKFHWAMAHIEGDKVIVYSKDVSNPVAVRYGWSDVTDDANLFNDAGLPAPPFRSDKWKGVTEGEKYSVGR